MTAVADDLIEGIPTAVYQRRWLILTVLTLSLVTVVTAVSALNTALPVIQRTLGASGTQSQWIIDAYALVFAGMLLPAGALGDRFGRRGALQIGLVIFGIASLIASQLSDPTQLIGARAVMGIEPVVVGLSHCRIHDHAVERNAIDLGCRAVCHILRLVVATAGGQAQENQQDAI